MMNKLLIKIFDDTIKQKYSLSNDVTKVLSQID